MANLSVISPSVTERYIWWGTQTAVASGITGAATYVAQTGSGTFTAQASAQKTFTFYIDGSLPIPIPTKMRLLAGSAGNAVGPGATLTLGLYPMGTPIGGVGVLNPQLGTVVSGSTTAFGTTATGVNALNSATMTIGSTASFPAAGSFVMGGATTAYTAKTATTFTGCGNHAATTGGEVLTLGASLLTPEVNSGDFAVPVAGWYAIGMVSDAAMTANSLLSFAIRLEYRFV